MRSEEQMLEVILSIARDDERIRAVILNGSRVDPNAPRDFFQDFDVIFLVTEFEPFVNNLEWIKRFGELMILQLPDLMNDPPPGSKISFAYLMQFTDGNRIDLSIYPLAHLSMLKSDSLSQVLLDKDRILPELPPANDSDYLPQPPTLKQFADCCNEFWWVCPYVAKGLWRNEITYANGMLEQALRIELMKMITWYVGVNTSYSKNPGKLGKYLDRYLEPELWKMLVDTYADADYTYTWQALFIMSDLFRIVARKVGEHFDYDYPASDDSRVSAHLRHIKSLSRNAREMYE